MATYLPSCFCVARLAKTTGQLTSLTSDFCTQRCHQWGQFFIIINLLAQILLNAAT